MVTVAAPLERQVNQWDDYVGRFEASRSVEVRPRVSGQIVGVHFTDGQIVRQGQLLFTIDPRPFAAALAEARASVASAQSELALAETNLGRARRLLAERGRVAERCRPADRRGPLGAARRWPPPRPGSGRARSTSSSPMSARRSAAASPTAGSMPATSSRRGETLLTTINALDPIYFTFDVPESLFLKTARAPPGRHRVGPGRRDPAAGRGRL